MTPLSLRHRMLLVSLLPSCLIAILLMSFFTYSSIRNLDAEIRARGLTLVRHLAPGSEYGIIAGQSDLLYNLVQASVQDPGIKSAMVVSRKGRVLAVSGKVSLGSEIIQHQLDAPTVVNESERWIAYGAPVMRSSAEMDPLFDTILMPKLQQTEVIGQVFIELDKSELLQRQREILLRSIAIVGVCLLGMAALTIGIADNLIRPILRLVKAVSAMSSGHWHTRVPASSGGDIGVLEAGFNEMAERIQSAHQSMQERIEEATAQLAFQARHDPLTGLINRQEFENRLERRLAAIQSGAAASTLLFIDLDRFKPVNDTCGHQAGDELLRQIAQLFRGRLREEDTLARLGGDEFGIILDDTAGPRARQVAEDLCALTSSYRFIWQDKIFVIGASIGLTPISADVSSLSHLMSTADSACYRAKAQGRNQVCEQQGEQPPERREKNVAWMARIMSALAEGRIVVEAHPLRTLYAERPEPQAAELSARLIEPGQSSISMAALIDAAERYELAPEIDRQLLSSAIDALVRARQAGKRVRCLVPISMAGLNDQQAGSIEDFIGALLQTNEISADGLCLLVSEESAIRHSNRAQELSRAIRRLNGSFGLDDFGAGISSFNLLHLLKPEFVKLSAGLTREINNNRASTALLRAIREITSDQGISVIADGIDSLDMLDPLTRLQINSAKGKATGPLEPLEVWMEGAVIREHPGMVNVVS